MPRDERWVGTETVPRSYINNVQIATSNHDVRLRMGVIVRADADVIETECEMDVFMSRPHAQALCDRLMESLGMVAPQMPDAVGTVN